MSAIDKGESRAQRLLRRRALQRSRPFTMRLLEDERLRDQLDDDATQALYGWVVALLEAQAAATAALDNEAAEDGLSQMALQLKGLMQQFNAVLGSHAAVVDSNGALIDVNLWLLALDLGYGLEDERIAADIEAIVADFASVQSADLFDRIFAWTEDAPRYSA